MALVFVSDRHRLLFIHVQKTGGVTIERHLRGLIEDGRTNEHLDLQRHSGLSAVIKRYPEMGSYFVFGVVRNPWSRMLSWWRMIERVRARAEGRDPEVSRIGGSRAHPFWTDMVLNCPDFEAFVHDAPERWQRLRKPQVEYLVTPRRIPDLVGRTESLEADLRALVARFDLPWQPLPPPQNADPSPVPSYREFYDDATRDRVGELFAKDVAHFGYEY